MQHASLQRRRRRRHYNQPANLPIPTGAEGKRKRTTREPIADRALMNPWARTANPFAPVFAERAARTRAERASERNGEDEEEEKKKKTKKSSFLSCRRRAARADHFYSRGGVLPACKRDPFFIPRCNHVSARVVILFFWDGGSMRWDAGSYIENFWFVFFFGTGWMGREWPVFEKSV